MLFDKFSEILTRILHPGINVLKVSGICSCFARNKTNQVAHFFLAFLVADF